MKLDHTQNGLAKCIVGAVGPCDIYYNNDLSVSVFPADFVGDRQEAIASVIWYININDLFAAYEAVRFYW